MKNLLVLQSDFGLVDGAVAAMMGVAYNECSELKIENLTHDITPYNIFEASYRLAQTVEYWPSGTVFVSVVDPGVGTHRKSVVALTTQGHYIVTPDNGTLTHIHQQMGIIAIREIEESKQRRANSEYSYTFHGRDLYAYVGAKLACGKIRFEEVGQELSIEHIIEVEVSEVVVEPGVVKGAIDILDVRFGSLWTNIPREAFLELDIHFNDKVEVSIYNGTTLVYQNNILYGRSFADTMIGSGIVYINSLMNVGIAINQGSFAKAYNIGVGSHWKIELRKV